MDPFLTELQTCLPALLRTARGLTRSPDRAEDLVQDCVERALRKRDLWQPSGTMQGWLTRMMVNLYRSQLRTPGGSALSIPLDDLTTPPQAPDSLTPRLDLADTARALDTLPPEQREVLLVVVLGGLTYAEAARALDLPLGTLMSRLGRARAALRTALKTPGLIPEQTPQEVTP